MSWGFGARTAAPGDETGRAEKLGLRWKRPVVVENRTGASEIVAATLVKDAPPDGYTLFLATEVGLETNRYLFSRLSYDPEKDFLPITRVIEGALIYVVKRQSDQVDAGSDCAQRPDKHGIVREAHLLRRARRETMYIPLGYTRGAP